MRTFDVWVGRIAAAAGSLCVALATCADTSDAQSTAMLAVSFVTVALMALLSRSDAMTARFYTDVG